MCRTLLALLFVVAAVSAEPALSRVPRGIKDQLYQLYKSNSTESCLCVPFHVCDDGKISTDGAGLIDPRFGPTNECKRQFAMCCKDEEKIRKIEAKPGVDKSVMTSIKDGISELFGGGGNESHTGVGADECYCVAFYMCDGGVLAPEQASKMDRRQLSSTGRCNYDNQLCCTLPKARAPVSTPACNCTGRQYCSQKDIQPLRPGQTACRQDEVCCSSPQPVHSGGSGGGSSTVPDPQRPDYDHWKFCKSFPLSVACVRSRQINARPTLKPQSNFDADLDAQKLNQAIGYFDATDSVLIGILTERTFEQRYLIADAYNRITQEKRCLSSSISSTTRGHFDDLMVALTRNASYYEYLADELYNSMHRVGTDEDTVLETLISSTGEEIEIIKRHYSRLDGSPNLIADIKSDFSGHLEDLLVALVNGSRDNSFRVSQKLAAEQAAALYKAGESRLGTQEETFMYYLTHENYAQLALIFSHYEQLTRESFSEALEDEFSRHTEDAVLAIVEVTRNLPRFFALRLHDALWGRGPLTKDDSSLIRIIVSRAEIDLGTIAEEYKAQYDRALIDDVELKTTGDYEKALKRLLSESDNRA